MREWLASLPSGHHAEKIATFDTKVDTMRHLPGSAAKGAAKVAHRHGYDSAARAESFYVDDVEGPLLEGELDRAREWGVSSPGPWLTSDLERPSARLEVVGLFHWLGESSGKSGGRGAVDDVVIDRDREIE